MGGEVLTASVIVVTPPLLHPRSADSKASNNDRSHLKNCEKVSDLESFEIHRGYLWLVTEEMLPQTVIPTRFIFMTGFSAFSAKFPHRFYIICF